MGGLEKEGFRYVHVLKSESDIAAVQINRTRTWRPNIEQLLVELDGCHIRTSILLPVKKAAVTKKRRLLKRKRESDWQEVRVGLVRPVSDKEKRTNATLA